MEVVEESGPTEVTVLAADLRTGANHRTGPSLSPDDRDPVVLTVRREAGSHPTQLVLRRNVPNPFSDATTLRFELPRATRVELTIYDVQGRRVRQIVSGTLEAGSYERTWDGRDDSGAPVASGAYFCWLRTTERNLKRTVLFTR